MLSLVEARARILERAEPGETIEVCLAEALGLVLAEPAIADVDLPRSIARHWTAMPSRVRRASREPTPRGRTARY